MYFFQVDMIFFFSMLGSQNADVISSLFVLLDLRTGFCLLSEGFLQFIFLQPSSPSTLHCQPSDFFSRILKNLQGTGSMESRSCQKLLLGP